MPSEGSNIKVNHNTDKENEGWCWFCGQFFYVEEDDNINVEIFFEDSFGHDHRLIRTMDVPLCTSCGSRLLSAEDHDEAARGPSVIFRVYGNDL